LIVLEYFAIDGFHDSFKVVKEIEY